HDDSPRGRVAVSGIEALEAHGMTVGTEISRIGSIGARRRCIRAWLIGETLEPPRVGWVRPAAVRYPVRANAAVVEIEKVETRRPRGKRKICDPEEVAVRDEVTMHFERIQCALQQTRCYRSGDSANVREGGPRHGRRQAGDGGSQQPATRNSQDALP